jgi:hypothetical protein
MTSLTDSELQTRLRALRVPPPAGEFHAQLSERLREVASAQPARVVPLRKWRTPRRVALLLAAAALPLGAYAATGGWIPGWGPSEPASTTSTTEQAPATESPRKTATRSAGATAPTPPTPTPAPELATPASEKATAAERAPRTTQRTRANAPDVQPARVEQHAETEDAGERAATEERRATERVRIRMNTDPKGSSAAGQPEATRIRPGRTQASRSRADSAGPATARGSSRSTADSERERTWRRERERRERSERPSQDRHEKMRLRAH